MRAAGQQAAARAGKKKVKGPVSLGPAAWRPAARASPGGPAIGQPVGY